MPIYLLINRVLSECNAKHSDKQQQQKRALICISDRTCIRTRISIKCRNFPFHFDCVVMRCKQKRIRNKRIKSKWIWRSASLFTVSICVSVKPPVSVASWARVRVCAQGLSLDISVYTRELHTYNRFDSKLSIHCWHVTVKWMYMEIWFEAEVHSHIGNARSMMTWWRWWWCAPFIYV